VHEPIEPKPEANLSRRATLKRLAYLAPVVLTLPAKPSFVSAGSKDKDKEEDKEKKD
jgi:hypothetical protein